VKKILIIVFLLLMGCDTNYKPNIQINSRKAPIVVIAIDTVSKSVLMRDGDNQVFTIYDNPTTEAITKSLKVGDTIRLSSRNSFNKKF
jgi:hypothetical protein